MLKELRRAHAAASDELAGLVDDEAAFAAKEAEILVIKGKIERAERAQSASAALARPLDGSEGGDNGRHEPVTSERTLSSLVAEARNYGSREGRKAVYDDCLSIARKGLGITPDKTKNFGSFGEQLQSIFNYYASKGSSTDSRLVRAPTGAGEVDPTGGGFLVQVDFAASIFMLAHDMGEIISRVSKTPISANANGLKIPGVDETSRATGSRWGGVASNWAAEGVTGTESRPKFRMVEFDLKKLISKMTVTDELLQDSTALTSIAAQAFSEEVMFMTEDAIVEGTGAGQPLGFLNAPALVSVAKEQGQQAGTVVKENIDKMWTRCNSRSRSNAVWLINQDMEPQLAALNGAVGTGGALVYMPPGGISAAPFATLKGRPIVTTEYNPALGVPGDIALVDLSQYMLVDKGGVQMATSMHVSFNTDEMVFRITYRVDGKPMWTAARTRFKGGNTESPFVVIAAR
ncbi:phage major capsid protein, HK97 family [Bradyrhizobium lablabi]|uniref:Phage major capsid protein, HK97 family n=1 Tax=Bradyrhizobium lablabi TaxID=722472 RepID=A0A1M6LH97_9BRAD|nr:phage major capsid protein [Bradyrhizobium lablabi]SHJ70571.1 phage major capsid protein, HK97 family [Bradyrhizobium lablabi]